MPTAAPSPREVALDLLDAVLHRRRPLEDAVGNHPNFAQLAPRDRAFARNLIATALRRLGQIDDLIDRCLDRPLPPAARPARAILRLGVAQLLFLGTPAHAAVDTSVELAGRHKAQAYKKLINAVLRRLEREGTLWLAEQDPARLNTPDWLWQSWRTAYGDDTCRKIAEAHLHEPALDLTVNGDVTAWAARLDAVVLPTGSLRRAAGGPIVDLPGYAEGAWWVQDAAAALPARLLGDVRGRSVIDLCAAPGGKTAQLAAAGACVTAIERTASRLKRLKENLARLNLQAEIVQADAAKWRPAELADAVLLDAPCSATGTIRRHPDVARLKTPDDVATLAVTQARLLAAALAMVKPGGVLVYGACSLQSEEGPLQTAAILAGSGATRIPIRAGEVGGLAELIDTNGDLRTLPCHLAGHGGLDGFYAVRLRRT
jgi:16S rRNA (cytosine967-C5)-methyltransferase